MEAIAAYGGGGAKNITGEGEPERVQGTMVTHNLLDMLGTRLALGRNFAAEEDVLGGPDVTILGYSLWQRRFGGARDVVGKKIILNDTPKTIIGVLPAHFRFPDNNFLEELLLPMALPGNPNWQDEKNFRLLRVLALAKAGVTPETLRQEFANIVRVTAAQEPEQMVNMRKDMEVRVIPLREWLTGNIRSTLVILNYVVIAVLLIACLNVAGLQAARAVVRRREMAIRAAVGAGAGRLARQLLTESLLLSAIAAAAGTGLAYASLKPLRAFLPESLHLADLVTIDSRVLAFTIATAVIAGLLTGLLPALSSARTQANEALKSAATRTTSSRVHQRLQGSLVVAEVAVAVTLLAGAGLLVRTFVRLAAADPGFRPQGVLTLKVAPSPKKYPQNERRIEFYREVLERAKQIPGVEYAAIGGGIPIAGTLGAAGVSFQDRPEPPIGNRPSIPTAFVSADYFRALGIPLLEGRVFTDADRGASSMVAIVNEAFARQFYPGQSAIGKRIEFGSREGRWREIVGVVGNVKQQRSTPVDPYAVFGPYSDSFEPETYLILRTNVPPESVVTAAAQVVRAVDPNEPIFQVASMEHRLEESLSGPRASMSLVTIFAGLALALATVGIFGVIAYFVSGRTQEIGIRMALGATRAGVFGMVLGHGLWLAAAGIAIGIGTATALARMLEALMEGVRGNDPWALGIAAATFLVVAASACAIPARWASRVDPAIALRQD